MSGAYGRAVHCRYHCRRCGSHFTSLEAFDAHRSGTPQDRACSFPDDAGLVELAGATCAISGPDPVPAVTVYGTARATRASEYYRGQTGRHTARANVSGAVGP